MKVVSGPEVDALVHERGGRLYVRHEHQRCCQGGATLVASSDAQPGRSYQRVDWTGFELWFDPGNLEPPDELHLEVKGWRSKRVEAYWDGCVFVT
ncbi:MAG TPA: hypothetical protein VFM81_10935 [Actinomycetota bacterium]|nr:hypothetical protein [Actinomycetota bacterium]